MVDSLSSLFALPVSLWAPPSILDGTEVPPPFRRFRERSEMELMIPVSWLIGESTLYATDVLALLVSSNT